MQVMEVYIIRSIVEREVFDWNLITSYKNGFQNKDIRIYHYSSAAPTIIAKKENFDFWMLAFLNGIVASTILNMYNPTLNYNCWRYS